MSESRTGIQGIQPKQKLWIELRARAVCRCQLIPDRHINHRLWSDTDQCGKVCVPLLLRTLLRQSARVTGWESGFVRRISGRFKRAGEIKNM
ncbi:hypothetical protein F2P81_025069 [Scophthalmus maximus]|uniref:Uncharacterized protein n=1 Tax=Scophthalmus maximus TaxID=52904 RepID=A0A6A4RQV2_SCOMX|nr:hypothetical protein F2P81_025069 [Scophthalmus maximus]